MQAAAMTIEKIAHPFAQFGPGPYTLVGYEDTEAREKANAYQRNAGLSYTTNMCGGSCDLCGTAIWNVYIFAAADGRKFKVGCDCAEKAGEGREAKEGRIRLRREDKAREVFAREDARLEAQRDRNEAAGYGRVTDDEHVTAVKAAVEAEKAALRAGSVHWGEVGVRTKRVELRYEGHYTFETAFGRKTIYFLRTLDGNATIWGTTGGFYRRADGTVIEKGQTFFAAATVKKHGDYKGEKQTEVTRLKVLAPEVAK